MSENLEINRFTYVIGANRETELELISWVTTSLQYINQYFEGDRTRIVGTEFNDCVLKVDYLVETLLYSSDMSLFRGIRDINGCLQAAAIISFSKGEIYPYNQERDYLYLDTLTKAPWNCLEGVTFPQTVKGAGTWLMSEIIEEVINTEIAGLIKLSAIDRAKTFYSSIGFQQNPEYQREMILTTEEAIAFLERYKIYKEN